jgi:hypothetical protein
LCAYSNRSVSRPIRVPFTSFHVTCPIQVTSELTQILLVDLSVPHQSTLSCQIATFYVTWVTLGPNGCTVLIDQPVKHGPVK